MLLRGLRKERLARGRERYRHATAVGVTITAVTAPLTGDAKAFTGQSFFESAGGEGAEKGVVDRIHRVTVTRGSSETVAASAGMG